ncbi:MAG: thioesterase family protein [Halieaceae bacterium]
MQDFTVTITPRMYETDAMGHISNVTITAWFEILRVRYLESVMASNPGTEKRWILASTNIDFVGETFYGEDVIAKMVDMTIGNTSITFKASMSQGGRQTMQGRAVLVHMDYSTRKPTRVPDDVRQAFAAR